MSYKRDQAVISIVLIAVGVPIAAIVLLVRWLFGYQ
jgi:hypothetical protein